MMKTKTLAEILKLPFRALDRNDQEAFAGAEPDSLIYTDDEATYLVSGDTVAVITTDSNGEIFEKQFSLRCDY